MCVSTVTWRSSIASSSADCVFGDGRLISSASTTFANTPPGRNSNSSVPRFHTETPTTSEGRRSGVNWIRCHVPAIDARDRLGQRGLADAGHVLDEEVALGEQAHEREAHLVALALDHPLDVGERSASKSGRTGAARLSTTPPACRPVRRAGARRGGRLHTR